MNKIFLFICFTLLLSSSVLAENYAFIVGIGGYDEKQLDPLGPYPRNDAIEFRDVLIESGFQKENIVLMVDDLTALPKGSVVGRYLPEAAKIRKELQLLLPSLERDDSLIIALAGHGVQFKGDDQPYFCPLDANLDEKNSLISLTWLYDQLEYDAETGRGCQPRQKLLLIDACRNDPASKLFRDASASPGLASVTLPQLAPIPEGIVALFSCAEGQQALQHEPLQHGVFFHHVLQGWKGKADGNGDQKITLDEIISFTKLQTQTYARTKLASLQTPRQKGYFDGTWILTTVENSDYEQGLNLYLGRGVLMDRVACYEHFKKSAHRGHALSKAFLWSKYIAGKGTNDPFEAERWYPGVMPQLQIQAENGDPVAQVLLGEMYDNGRVVEQNKKEAAKWYRVASDKGYALAQLYLGHMYWTGSGVSKDTEIARKLIHKSADQNYAPALYYLGTISLAEKNGKISESAAFDLLLKSARLNYDVAQWEVGARYDYGLGVPENDVQAFFWLKKSADQNNPNGQNHLALLYKKGQGVKKDYLKSLFWLRKAASQGHIEAMSNIGYMYDNGLGVKKNIPEALQWYRQAAEDGYSPAMNYIGLIYYNGDEVPQNFQEAEKWFRKSADLGNFAACVNIGKMYRFGFGVKKNFQESARWYRKAANSDDTESAARAKEALRIMGFSPNG